MALKVYTSGNYIITDTGTVMHEFAKGYTTYSYNQSTQIFTIRESVGGSFTVTRAQVLAGDITDESSVAYTFNSFVTFLRENTGFKTATGGSVATPIGATLLKTNQSVSYRTGDDGDIEAGRSVDFFTLSANNPFNNTNRFTDVLGGQTYTNNWVIDWSTYDGSNVLGYFRIPQNADTWDNAVTNSLGTFGTFSGCRLTNRKEIENLINISTANVLQYSPFTISDNLWTSSTTVFSSGNAWQLNISSGGLIDFAGKVVLKKYIPCRTFTVTGTTLS